MTFTLEALPIFESHWAWSQRRNEPPRCVGQLRVLDDSDERWTNLRCDGCGAEWAVRQPKPLSSRGSAPADLTHDPSARDEQPF